MIPTVRVPCIDRHPEMSQSAQAKISDALHETLLDGANLMHVWPLARPRASQELSDRVSCVFSARKTAARAENQGSWVPKAGLAALFFRFHGRKATDRRLWNRSQSDIGVFSARNLLKTMDL